MRQAGFLGDVLEGAVSFLVIEGDERVAAGAVSLTLRAVDEHHVETPIIVAIEEPCAAAGRIDHVMRLRSGNVDGSEANIIGDVLEGGDGRQAAAVFLCGCGEPRKRNTDAPRLLAGSLWMRGGCERKTEDENGKNREKAPRAGPQHVSIVSQRVLKSKRLSHNWTNSKALQEGAARIKRPAKPSAGLAGRLRSRPRQYDQKVNL